MKKTLQLLILILILSYNKKTQAQTEAGLLRFPAIYNDKIAFSSGGDIYTVDKKGGLARRLTSHIGNEIFPHFSPDGSKIAFTGQYEGNTEVFIIPTEGGQPKRLTYTATLNRDELGDRMGPNNIVMCWTPDGKGIVYRSRRYSYNHFRGQLFIAPIEGGLSKEIPIMNGGFCSYSPDGKKMALNRVFREFRTWKYYTGGMADDIWIYDTEKENITNITENKYQDIIPMWYEDKIFYISDRDRRMNLFCYDLNTKETKKVTNFTDYDIKYPSIGNKGEIIFEKGGFIFIYNINTNTSTKVEIQIKNDGGIAQKELVNAASRIREIDGSPDGNRIVFGARGEIFNVPIGEGVSRNLSKTSSAHERSPSWSPDGKYIAYISDKSGEYEIYIQAQDGSEEAIQLTKNAETYKYKLKWSPDSKKIIWNDKLMRLRMIDIETKNITEIAQSDIWEFYHFNFSPDSKWITYAKAEHQNMTVIYLYNIAKKESYAVTEGWYTASSPQFSTDGKYLLFSSSRDFNPIYSNTEWNHVYRDMSRVYLLPLSKKTPSPFAHKDKIIDMEEKKENKKEEKNENNIMQIDTDNMSNRIIGLPIASANYWNIIASGDKVFYTKSSLKTKGSEVYEFNLKTKKEKKIASNTNYSLLAKGKKILIAQGGKFGIINFPCASMDIKKYAQTSDMQVWVDKKEEWKQIYYESWRQMRDFFAFPNMHNVDWNAMKDKYAKMLPYVKHRDELTYIIGELIGEINIGHAYVSSGDKPRPQRIKMGLLGAKFETHKSGYFKVKSILKGANWDKKLRSPLTEQGSEVKEGEFIIAINGEETKNHKNIFELLTGKANKAIELTVNSKATSKGARKVIVVPIADEANLYYYNWVQNNIKKVSEATDGQVGYIHIPDMSPEGLNQFIKHFYPQLNKKALIIDDRGNGGGNVSPMIIERLRRELVFNGLARNQKNPSTTPAGMLTGPKVLLIDNYSASDGDLFPYQFKFYKLGKLIGVRTWGAVTGIRGSLPFIDGGELRRPEFAKYSADGKEWVIEGHGVEPDIRIDNNPIKDYKGEDEQLNKAISVIMEEIKNYKKGKKAAPPFPDKSK